MTEDDGGLELKCINTIRFLAADAVQNANSGHPGAPMGAAPMAFALWDSFLKHNPCNPLWPDRDRFVLSAGHASALIYSLLHLTGYELSIEDLKSFRRWGSKTPGHPEYRQVPGIEATTGPLGQGLAHAVGMAIAEAHLAARFNREDSKLVDHFTYVLASDGDLMEGVSAEACSLAGHLGLGKLIVLYDDNRISLAGSIGLCFTENVKRRFDAYGWHVQEVQDGNDVDEIKKAIKSARKQLSRPSLICVRTVIGYGAPNAQGTFRTHGAPLGEEELRAAKANLGWPAEPAMYVPGDARAHFRRALAKGKELEGKWERIFSSYALRHPEEAKEFARTQVGGLSEGWDAEMPDFAPEENGPATRKASEAALGSIAAKLPELIGGSADLNPSTFTWIKEGGDFQRPAGTPLGMQGAVGGGWSYNGRNIHYGVREHAMGAIAGGMALHGGTIPFTGTFLVFSDYMRPPMRLAAMNRMKVIYVFTHDSVGVGEDGPTHQPIEQIMNLRGVPNLTVIRPADANETVQAWLAAVSNDDGPTALVLSRQKLPVIDRSECASALALRRGAYILWSAKASEPHEPEARSSGPESPPGEDLAGDGELAPLDTDEDPEESTYDIPGSGTGPGEVVLIATGSEVHIALEAGRRLGRRGVGVRVVSMPSWELFEKQGTEYREMVLPPSVRARVAVEAGTKIGWERYVGLDGTVVGMDGFGASAPADVLYERFGITPEAVVAGALRVMEKLEGRL